MDFRKTKHDSIVRMLIDDSCQLTLPGMPLDASLILLLPLIRSHE